MDANWIHKIVENLPFTMGLVSGQAKINKARVIEALVIGVLAGMVSSYVAIKQMEVMIEQLKEADKRIESKIDRLYDEVLSSFFTDIKKEKN